MKPESLVRLRIALYTVWAIGNSWVGAMAGVKWSTMGWEEQSCVIGGMLMSWSGMMIAFYDKSVWKLDEWKKNGGGKVPPGL